MNYIFLENFFDIKFLSYYIHSLLKILLFNVTNKNNLINKSKIIYAYKNSLYNFIRVIKLNYFYYAHKFLLILPSGYFFNRFYFVLLNA